MSHSARYSKGPQIGKRKSWTQEQYDFLRTARGQMPAEEIGKHLGVSRSAVLGMARRLKLPAIVDEDAWTPAQIERLRAEWLDPAVRVTDMEEWSGRSAKAIHNKGRSIGLPCRTELRKQPMQATGAREIARERKARWRAQQQPKPKPAAPWTWRPNPKPVRRCKTQPPNRSNKVSYALAIAARSANDGRRLPCCWPIGEPGTPGFRFCEVPSPLGSPYCPEHRQAAYVPHPARARHAQSP
jgi:GcrA cell cycle regulator